MTDAQVFLIIWFGAALTLAFVAALHPLLHWIGRLCGEWLAQRASMHRRGRRDNITRLPALTNNRRRRP